MAPSASADLAELSTLRAQLDEITERVERLANGYAATPNSAVSAALFAAERALVSARRAIELASTTIGDG